MIARRLSRESQSTELEPHERLLARVIRIAIADAQQTAQPYRQREALEFLWHCCPMVAERVGLPEPPEVAR